MMNGGYIILRKISQKNINDAIKYGDVFSIDPRTTGIYIGEDENVYTFTVNRTITIREKLKMATAKKKVVTGWGFENAKGNLINDVFSTKENATGSYFSSMKGFKLVKVQISKYVAKK